METKLQSTTLSLPELYQGAHTPGEHFWLSTLEQTQEKTDKFCAHMCQPWKTALYTHRTRN